MRFHGVLLAACLVGLASCTLPEAVMLSGGLPPASPDAVGVNTAPISGSLEGTRDDTRLQATVNSFNLQTGDERPLVTLLKGANGGLPTEPLVWTSSDDHIANITPTTGQVKGVTAGTVVITAALQSDPSVRVLLTVNVVATLTVVLIKVTPNRLALPVGDSAALAAEVHLADGTINGNVVWTSSDNTIAAVNPTTGSVTALRDGKVTIEAAYAQDFGYKGLAVLTVGKDTETPLPAVRGTPVVFGPDATPIPATTVTAAIVIGPTSGTTPAATTAPATTPTPVRLPTSLPTLIPTSTSATIATPTAELTPTPATTQNPYVVHIRSNEIDPVWIIIPGGATVTWINDDKVPHHFYPFFDPSGRVAVPELPEIPPGGSYSFTFTYRGQYFGRYYDPKTCVDQGRCGNGYEQPGLLGAVQILWESPSP